MKNKKKGRGGRPPKITEVIIKKLEEAFAIGCSNQEACFYADISNVAFYNLLERQPEMKERFESLKLKPILKARQEVVKGLDKNPEFSLRYLERKLKSEFGLRTEVVQANVDLEDILNEFEDPDEINQSILHKDKTGSED